MPQSPSANTDAFFAEMAPYAVQASQATGLDARLILAQWANETANGSSTAWTNFFNPAGIGITDPSHTGANYNSIAGGVQAYINFVNDNPRYQAVKSAVGFDAQAQALGASGWAAGGYNDGGGPGSSLIAAASEVEGPIQSAASSAGVNPNVVTNDTGGGANPNATPAASASNTTNVGNTLGLGQVNVQSPDALQEIAGDLGQYGLGGLANWAWGELTGGKNSDQILLDLEGNNGAPGTPMAQAQATFQARFPGIALRVKNGLPAMDPSTYLQYEDSAYQMAQAAGLPKGFMDANTIGQLIGNDVSSQELSSRITSGYEAAMNADPNVRANLATYFGIDTGNLAAYYLDPTKTEDLLKQQLVAAQVGAQSQESGFGSLSASDATDLATLLNTQGKVGPTLGGSWNTDQSSTFAKLSKLTPLENALPGQSQGPNGAMSQEDLLRYGFAGANTQELQNVENTRMAPFRGGGGYGQTAKGAVSAGYASVEGQEGT